MSSPHVIIAAVCRPEDSIEEWWKENYDSLDSFEKGSIHNNEWYRCRGEFKSEVTSDTYPVETWYHSGRGEDVIEICIDGQGDMQDIQISGLEDIIKEINTVFEESNFTLEVYYWYDGVDKPGGVGR